jgi:putative PEP-CTERM system TPR-repeat lipoprotein
MFIWNFAYRAGNWGHHYRIESPTACAVLEGCGGERDFIPRGSAPMSRPLKRHATAIAVATCVALAACSSKNADESLAAAKRHLSAREDAAAVIELKNALQSNPDLAEARFLLGRALLDSNDPAGAAVELRKARDLNFPDDQVLPPLATALLRSGDFRKVIELGGANALAAPEAIASLQTTLALAYEAEGGADDKSAAALATALQAKADYAPALLFQARMLAARGELDASATLVDGVLAAAPDDPAALLLKGRLLLAGSDEASAAEAATALFRRALAAQPGYLPAHIALMSQLLRARDLDAARSQLAAMQRFHPRLPQTIYFQAYVQAMGGDATAASETLQPLLKSASPGPEVLRLAGVLAMRRGDLRQAEMYLAALVKVAPSVAGPRQMLAQVQLRAGDTDNALATLAPLLEGSSPDGRTLGLAGSAYLTAGEMKKAEQMFSLAAKADPKSARNRTSLAMARGAMGGLGGAVPELETIAESDDHVDADLALLSIELSRRNYDAALKAIDRLASKQPGKAMPFVWRARVLGTRGDLAGARASFEKALAVEPGYFLAVAGLATLDLGENKPELARARFEAALRADPGEARAMLGLAMLDEQAGKPKELVAQSIGKAIAIKPDDPTPRARLAQYHMGNNDYKLALAAAQDAVAALPNDAGMLALLGAAQLANGDVNQAVTTYGKLVAAKPRLPGPLLALAEAQGFAKSYDAAAETVKKAMAMAPQSMAVQQMAMKIDLQAGHVDRAIAKARALQAQMPQSPQGWIFEGTIQLSRGNWVPAAAAFRIALQKEASSEVARQLYLALRGAGDKAKAEAFAADWMKKHPQDAAFLFNLADLSIQEKHYEKAVRQLEAVLRISPDAPLALNNLAWVQATLKRPGAVANAERANQLSPDQPEILDTLAYALATEGNITAAIDKQKLALKLAPAAHAMRLRLASLYLQAGDKTAARTELDTLAKLGNQFRQQGEVQELRSRL